MMVDVILVKKLLTDLHEKKDILVRKKIKDFREFNKDPFLHNAVQHILEVMVEICIDIGNHIIADKKWPLPSSNREIFEVLHKHDVISNEVLKTSKKMVGFRNIVVHMYEKVDLEEVYAIYRKHLGIFDKFAAEIDEFISLK